MPGRACSRAIDGKMSCFPRCINVMTKVVVDFQSVQAPSPSAALLEMSLLDVRVRGGPPGSFERAEQHHSTRSKSV